MTDKIVIEFKDPQTHLTMAKMAKMIINMLKDKNFEAELVDLNIIEVHDQKKI